MTASTFLPPERGDVFALVSITDVQVKPEGWRDRLKAALMFKRTLPADLVEVDYRLVIGVTPSLVYYREAENPELQAAWLSEWGEWVIGAELVAERGVPIPETELQALTGETEIPFNLEPWKKIYG
jgi:hypothetical protein